MKKLILFLYLISSAAFAIEPSQMIVVVNDEQAGKLLGVKAVKSYFNRKKSTFSMYSLDGVTNFEGKLSEGLSSDMEEAKQQARDKYEAMGKKKMTKLILKAYKAKMLTLQYKLEKYPAIIFDDKYVVYGEFNLNTALNEYLAHKER